MIIALALVLLLGIAGVMAVRQFSPRPIGGADLLAAGVLVAVGLAGLVHGVRRSRANRREEGHQIVVTTEGIEVFDRGMRAFRVRASLLATVRVFNPLLSPLRGVRVGFGGIMIVHHDLGYLPQSDAERLAAAIRALIDERTARDPTNPEPPAYPDATRSAENPTP